MGAVLVGLLLELGSFAKFSKCVLCRKTHRNKICCSVDDSPLHDSWM